MSAFSVAQRRAIARQEHLPAFETACVDELAVKWTSRGKHTAIRQGLAVRFHLVRRVLLITTVASCASHVLAVGLRIRSVGDGNLSGWHWLRLALVAFTLPFVLSVTAASFPTDIGLATPSGRQLSIPLACIIFTNAAVYGILSTGKCLQLPATADTFVHIVFYVVFQLNWLVHAVLLCVGQRSPWGITRVALFIDGLLFILAALTLRYLGTTLDYPPLSVPGNTFMGATLRGIATLPLGLLFSPGVRQRIALSAHRVGWNHIYLSLGQSIGNISLDEYGWSSDSESIDGGRGSAMSHHTAKLDAAYIPYHPYCVLQAAEPADDSHHSDSESL